MAELSFLVIASETGESHIHWLLNLEELLPLHMLLQQGNGSSSLVAGNVREVDIFWKQIADARAFACGIYKTFGFEFPPLDSGTNYGLSESRPVTRLAINIRLNPIRIDTMATHSTLFKVKFSGSGIS
jgi:hypothetical protein